MLELSPHAAERIKQRRSTRAQLRSCLAKGKNYGVDLSGRRVRRIRFGSRVLEVVYLEGTKGYLVVTAYWRNKWP